MISHTVTDQCTDVFSSYGKFILNMSQILFLCFQITCHFLEEYICIVRAKSEREDARDQGCQKTLESN